MRVTHTRAYRTLYIGAASGLIASLPIGGPAWSYFLGGLVIGFVGAVSLALLSGTA